MNNGLDILAQGVVTQNVILFQGLAIYALLRFTKSLTEAVKAAIIMMASMLTAVLVIWALESLVPIGLGVRLPVVFIIALASGLLWYKITFGYIQGTSEYSVLSAFVNSALIGLMLNLPLAQIEGSSVVAYGFAGALGYGLVLIVMAGIRERLELADVPKPLQGVPIFLIAAGLLALGLLGFRL